MDLDKKNIWPVNWLPIVDEISAGFKLDLDGIHGLPHWSRVLENGMRLAQHTGANPSVISAFALLHDCQRENDGFDPQHGMRGAELGKLMRSRLPSLSDIEFGLFYEAAAYHSDGLIDGDVTVQTCWDADRLDLYRVGIRPNPHFLCTEAARHPDIIVWAVDRSARETVSQTNNGF
jgi:uncharacterized protein